MLGKIVHCGGVQNSGIFNIAEMDNFFRGPEKFVRRRLPEVTGDVFPCNFARKANLFSQFFALPFTVGMSVVPGNLSDRVMVFGVKGIILPVGTQPGCFFLRLERRILE